MQEKKSLAVLMAEHDKKIRDASCKYQQQAEKLATKTRFHSKYSTVYITKKEHRDKFDYFK